MATVDFFLPLRGDDLIVFWRFWGLKFVFDSFFYSVCETAFLKECFGSFYMYNLVGYLFSLRLRMPDPIFELDCNL